MFKLLATMFRNIVAQKPPAQTKFLRERGMTRALDNFKQTVLFDTEGAVTTDGYSLMETPYLEAPPKALIGKAFDVRDGKALLRALPKGKLRELPIEASYVADDDKLTLKTANGQKVEAKGVTGHAANWPKWQDKIPQHGDYNEVAVDGKRLKKLVSDAVAQDNALGKARKGRGYSPKLVLRVSKNAEHPLELHTEQQVRGVLMPITDPIEHNRPKKAAALKA